jgi:hypothetical protein
MNRGASHRCHSYSWSNKRRHLGLSWCLSCHHEMHIAPRRSGKGMELLVRRGSTAGEVCLAAPLRGDDSASKLSVECHATTQHLPKKDLEVGSGRSRPPGPLSSSPGCGR